MGPINETHKKFNSKLIINNNVQKFLKNRNTKDDVNIQK